MDILINGERIEVESEPDSSLGSILAEADAILEKAGSVIVSLSIDGRDVDAGSYAEFANRSAAGARVEIRAEHSGSVRIRAVETLCELLGLALQGASVPRDCDWRSLRQAAIDIRDAFSGLFAADELSFVQLFVDLLDKAGDFPSSAVAEELATQCRKLELLFHERLSELLSPAAEMRNAAALFASQEAELSDLPVQLQTGKEDRAMRTMLYFIEVFNKVLRLIPEIRRAGIDTESIRIGELGFADFYVSLNAVLRELTEALEHKDAVLLGDLVEYEVLPRMKQFFAAMEEALPTS